MKFFFNNIELILSGVGIVVIIAVPMLFFSGSNVWHAAAITATIVGTLHGLIFWVVRKRQRQVREETITEIRRMLEEVTNNQLTVIMLSVSDTAKPKLEELQTAVSKISTLVNTLSEESLRSWKARYERVLQSLEKK
ncbi:MAG: hypothetical protein D6687_00770 [Acidobacteria bacterium]|jgi:dipeptide/tripeptide permease|nr:MAG: hypothetical protein D6687_00770 [Acidobacteriota bacterium]GIU83179.1 MAG: hypothetical protein KatS3mg006_2243 [Pyrinomonadaceae bacterium]